MLPYVAAVLAAGLSFKAADTIKSRQRRNALLDQVSLGHPAAITLATAAA